MLELCNFTGDERDAALDYNEWLDVLSQRDPPRNDSPSQRVPGTDADILCNPLTLRQLSRLSVRTCMRDGHIEEDSQKLLIPDSLKDYIALAYIKIGVGKCRVRC